MGAGLGNTEIDTLPQLTCKVIGRKDQPCHIRQSHQRLGTIALEAGHGFSIPLKGDVVDAENRYSSHAMLNAVKQQRNLMSTYGAIMNGISKQRLLAGVFLIVYGSLAYAGTVVCSGTVDHLAYHQPGKLMVRLSSMNVPVFICSADTDWVAPGSLAGTTSPAACKALYATFLSAKLSRGNINNLYLDGNQAPTACNLFQSFGAVNVRYYDYQ